MKKYITIDIGGTSIKHGVMDKNLTFYEMGECDTKAHLGGPYIMETITELIKTYRKKYELHGIAISTAGMVDTEKGEIKFANELIPNYTGTKIKERLEEAFGIPCEVENDVNCAGLSEALEGAGKGAQSVLCLTVGTGIGGCIILNQEVYHGFSGSACEVGYMQIPGGEFQKLGATSVMVKKVAERKGCSSNDINGKILFAIAKEGDEICNQAIDEMVDALCQGIANVCYVLNPEVVVLGGGIMAQKEFLEGKIQTGLDRHLIPAVRNHTKVTFARNQNQAGMLGAYFHFAKKHF